MCIEAFFEILASNLQESAQNSDSQINKKCIRTMKLCYKLYLLAKNLRGI
jgi:hypothetical protein